MQPFQNERGIPGIDPTGFPCMRARKDVGEKLKNNLGRQDRDEYRAK